MRIKHNGLECEVYAILVASNGLSYFIEDQDYGFTFVSDKDKDIVFIDDSMSDEWTIISYGDYLSGMYIIGPPCITNNIESLEDCMELFDSHLEQLKEFAEKEKTRRLEDFFRAC